LPFDERPFSAARDLESLRALVGDSEFGYRMQGVFAHVLIRLGGEVREVNAQGHPDILARMSDHCLKVQVKTALHSTTSRQFELAEGDLTGIQSGSGNRGYLAVLDCAPPVAWLLVPEARMRSSVGRAVHIATLQAERDAAFSEDCTECFLDLLAVLGPRLPNLTYRLLAKRALRGEGL